jgi:hypothetical protein
VASKLLVNVWRRSFQDMNPAGAAPCPAVVTLSVALFGARAPVVHPKDDYAVYRKKKRAGLWPNVYIQLSYGMPGDPHCRPWSHSIWVRWPALPYVAYVRNRPRSEGSCSHRCARRPRIGPALPTREGCSATLWFGALTMGAFGSAVVGVAPAYVTERFPTATRGVGPGFARTQRRQSLQSSRSG